MQKHGSSYSALMALLNRVSAWMDSFFTVGRNIFNFLIMLGLICKVLVTKCLIVP